MARDDRLAHAIKADTQQASPANPGADLQRVFYRQLSVIGSMMGTIDELRSLVAFCEASGIRPVIDTVRPLTEARQAIDRMIRGDVFGKIVFTR